MNITLTEWKAMEKRINAAIIQRWPWLHRIDRERINVESPMLAMGAELDWSHQTMSAKVRTRVDRSSAISGDLVAVAESCRQICEVRDVMLYVSGMVDGIVVWQDGECPCGHCSARGATRGGPCGNCNGTGKR